MSRGEVVDEELTRVFARFRERFSSNHEIREKFFEARDGITEMVRGCCDNVRITVFFDNILDEPLVVQIGKEENCLKITFKQDGRVIYCWTKETWRKFFRDCWEGGKCFIRNIISFLVPIVRNISFFQRSALRYEVPEQENNT